MTAKKPPPKFIGEPSIRRLPAPMAEYAEAIGFVCMQWTLMEYFLNDLLRRLLGFDEGQVIDAVTANADVRAKVQMVLALGLLKKVDDQWFNDLKEALDYVDNDLRAARNRYVHDLLTADHANRKFKKLQLRTKLHRLQPEKPLELTTRHETDIDAAEIFADGEAILSCAAQIGLLTSTYSIVTRRASRKKSP